MHFKPTTCGGCEIPACLMVEDIDALSASEAFMQYAEYVG